MGEYSKMERNYPIRAAHNTMRRSVDLRIISNDQIKLPVQPPSINKSQRPPDIEQQKEVEFQTLSDFN